MTNDTRRAAALKLYKELDEGLFKLRECLASHQTQERFAVDMILAHDADALQQARAAEREAIVSAIKDEVERISGNGFGEGVTAACVDIARFIEARAQEGG